MSTQIEYRAADVCRELNITNYTLTNWYTWEHKRIASGEVTEPYLPEPQRLTEQKGKPRVWTKEQVDQLRDYQSHIVVGRNGIYGEFTNPVHTQTKKYKKEVEEKK